MDTIYKVAIVGAGRIGANKPDHIDGPGTENILTHAHSVFHNPRTELFAIVDTDKEQLHKAVAKWQPIRAFQSVDELINDPVQPDIIIVAVPTEQHYSVIHKIALEKPKLIIAEKPFCKSLNHAKEVILECENVPVMVDYIRRFSTGHQDIKAKISSDTWGNALNCRVLYTRGLHHEGCHAIDLMNWFFGECVDKFVYNGPSASMIEDRDENDPTVYATFEYEKCPHVTFQPCDGRKYGIFEVDICFEGGRIRLIDNGLFYEYYPINEENEYGHKSLSYKLTEVIRRETGLNLAMYGLINNAINFLDGKGNLLCTANDAIAVHEVLERGHE